MTNTAANRPLGGEGIAALDGPVLAVIDQFWDENPHKRGNRDLEDLTPKEVLDIWLTWEGIQGYTEQIIKLIEDLGWKQKGE